jgi:hypothetical protein
MVILLVEMKKINKSEERRNGKKMMKKKRNLRPIVKKSYIEYQVFY